MPRSHNQKIHDFTAIANDDNWVLVIAVGNDDFYTTPGDV